MIDRRCGQWWGGAAVRGPGCEGMAAASRRSASLRALSRRAPLGAEVAGERRGAGTEAPPPPGPEDGVRLAGAAAGPGKGPRLHQLPAAGPGPSGSPRGLLEETVKGHRV